MSFLFKNLPPSTLVGRRARRLRSAGSKETSSRKCRPSPSRQPPPAWSVAASALDARPDRLPRPHAPQRGLRQPPGGGAAHPDDGTLDRPAAQRMLDRGFTTVRDAGGADWGTKTAVESGLIPGPRLFISCRSIGPTGGTTTATAGPMSGRPACAATAWCSSAASPTDRTRCARRRASRCARRRSGEADGVGRRRLAPRPAGIAAIHRGEITAAVEEACLRSLRAHPRLYAGSDHARRSLRRAHHRARQPGRRADRR